MISMKTNMQY